MYALAVRFTLRDGCFEAFDRLTEATVASVRANEPGTLAYVCGIVNDDPAARIFLEVYADRAAFEEHERNPDVQTFLREREALVAAIRVERTTPFAAHLTPGSRGGA